MECTLATLIACFSWSNLFIDSGLLYQDAEIPYFYWKDVSPPPGNGVVETAFVSAIGDESQNPYGRLALGYQLDLGNVVMSLELSHVSSLATDADRGVNSLQLRARWFPFR